jgi:hypothetical protein
VQQVQLAPQVRREQQDHKEQLVLQVHLDQVVELRVHKVRQARQEQRELLVQRVQQEVQEQLEQQEVQEQLVLQVPRELKEIQVLLVQLGQQVLQESQKFL